MSTWFANYSTNEELKEENKDTLLLANVLDGDGANQRSLWATRT